MKQFKYQHLMDSLKTPCPPKDFEERETMANRWVFGEMEDGRNFLPQYLKSPKRFFKLPPNTQCKAIGLSFYDTLENAKRRYMELKESLGGNANNIGTHVASGLLKEAHGLTGPVEKNGHLTHHPYEEVDLTTSFEIIETL